MRRLTTPDRMRLLLLADVMGRDIDPDLGRLVAHYAATGDAEVLRAACDRLSELGRDDQAARLLRLAG